MSEPAEKAKDKESIFTINFSHKGVRLYCCYPEGRHIDRYEPYDFSIDESEDFVLMNEENCKRIC